MSWSKRQLIEQAFEEIGLASYFYDLTPEQLNGALRRLDAMVAGWNANGVRIGYTIASNPDNADIDADSGVPDFAVEALYYNLAVRLAPSVGKQASAETKQFADMAYSNLANQVAIPTPELELPYSMPRGQGTKPWRNFNNPFIRRPEQSIDAGSDGKLDFE